MQSVACPSRLSASSVLLAAVLSHVLCATIFAQDTTEPTAPAASAAPLGTRPDTSPDASPDTTALLHDTIAQDTDQAWTMLSSAVQDQKHPILRIQALAALGTLGANPHSTRLIIAALSDPDLDVRTAAVLAAGWTGDRNLTTNLRNLLDDKEPQVVFAAATTLWKMNDHSGEDILLAIVNGDRKATAGLRSSTMHKVGRDLHSPATLARLGAMQGAAILLGPFGIGISAYEYMHNGATGNAARILAIEQVGQQNTSLIRTQLIAALSDKDADVRAATARALGNFHDQEVSLSLLSVFDDARAPVHLTAAASYLRSSAAPAARSMPLQPKRQSRSQKHEAQKHEARTSK